MQGWRDFLSTKKNTAPAGVENGRTILMTREYRGRDVPDRI